MGDSTASASVALLEDAFDACAFGVVDLMTLTDDQVIACDLEPRIAPFPSFAVTDPIERAAALARGRLPSRREDELDPRDVLRLTRSWLHCVEVTRQSDAATTFQLLYLRADGYATLEHVDTDGVHRFAVAKRAAALDLATEIATPMGDFLDSLQAPRRIGADEWADVAAGQLGAAMSVTTIASIDHPSLQTPDSIQRARAFVVYACADRIVCVQRDGGDVVLREVSRATVRRQLHRMTSVVTSDSPPGGSA